MPYLSTRAIGRLAGVLLVGSAAGWTVVLLLLPLEVEGLNPPIVLTSCLLALCLGIFALVAPWERLPPQASLLIAASAFVLVTAANTFSATIPQGFGAMCTVIFAWLGIAHRPGTATKFAIPVGLLVFVAILHQPGPMGGIDLAPATVIVVPTGVLVGEVLAWMCTRVRDAHQIEEGRLTSIRRLVAASELLADRQPTPMNAARVARLAIPSLDVAGALVTLLEADGSLVSTGSAQWPTGPENIRIDTWNVPALHDLVANRSNALSALPIVVTDVEELNVPRALAVPLVTSAGAAGVLFLVTDTPDDPFLQDLAHTYATQAGLALERSWATQTLIDATLRDELTGIGNRRHASAVLARVQVGDAVAMIDLDHFKEVNDTRGHAEGDRLLKALARYLQSRLRDEDHLARYGGEEFLLILHRSGPDAVQTIERLRTGWNATNPATGFSAGVAVHRTGVLPSHTLENADHALYEAKRAGRNRTHLHGGGGHHTEATAREAVARATRDSSGIDGTR